jgi:hypothetical protein
MATYNKFNAFVADVANKVHNFGSDTFKLLLTNTAPVATNAVKADLTEITAGSGYTAGGATVTLTSSTQSSGTYKYIASAASPTWTASGSMATFRYVTIYNSTAASGNLVGWWDNGSGVSLTTGQTFTVTLDGTNGVFQIA